MSKELSRDYKVSEEIGKGRFGVVYKCICVRSGKAFALKSIDKRSILDDPLDRQCLYNEAKIMLLLSPNPRILRVFDVYEDDDFLHLVLELCISSDLLQRLKSMPVFSEADAVAVMRPLMEAIAHCHRLGIAHRDIKPDNILFNEYNELKLADFGSAEYCHHQSMTGIVGTPYYVAPEILGGRSYDEKIDIWSSGVVLYIMLAGFPPFDGDSPPEIFEAVLRSNLRFPSRVFSSVSPAAKDLLRKMLCRDVSRRLSADQVLRHPWMTSSNVGETRQVSVEETRQMAILT